MHDVLFKRENSPIFIVLLMVSVGFWIHSSKYGKKEDSKTEIYESSRSEEEFLVKTTKSSKITEKQQNLVSSTVQTTTINYQLTSLETPDDNLKISYQKINLPENYKNTIIIAFTDINYIPVTKIWLERMHVLNYTNIRIYALDQHAYKLLISESELKNPYLSRNQIFETVGIELPDNYTQKTYEDGFESDEDKAQRIGNQHKIWKIRIDVVESLLLEGYSVLVSDVDAIWMKHIDLDSFPMNFDSIFTVAGGMPTRLVREWGFTEISEKNF